MKSIWSVTGGGYEWVEFHIYRHPLEGGKFAALSDAGCSCSYYEEPSVEMVGAESPLSIAEARVQLFNFLSQHSYYFDAGETIDTITRFDSELRSHVTD